MGLSGKVYPIDRLSSEQTDRMFEIMSTYYDHVDHQEFLTDLYEKESLILLTDESDDSIQGFSTQRLFRHNFQGRELQVLFSGDTIIEQAHWGSLALPVTWGRMMQEILSRAPETPLYWMLISKGFRTYRFFPVFFKEFYPRYDIPTPDWEKGLIDSLGRYRFPERYNEKRGIVQASPGAQRLKESMINLDLSRESRNPHIDFFFRSNPGFAHGDELVCILPFHNDNLRPYILRELGKAKGG